MKPLRVELEAFGSFADREVVDFEGLGGQRLFLIHGPTGAGKSTILEAICFALYGTPAGADASAPHLRSQHAAPERPTRVTLWFALGDTRYRIERTPRQLRPKKRGEGFVEERGTAVLERFKPGVPEDRPGEPLATKQNDVDTEVRRLLGLDRSQFRQVILLPQGEFRRLLEASSKERQEILSRLFDIDRYGDLERRLKSAADRLRAELGGLERERATLLGQAAAESEEAFALRRKALAEEIGEARTSLGLAEAGEKAAREAAETARSDRERLHAKKEAEGRFSALDARRPEFENERSRLRDAVRAEPVALRFDAVAAAKRVLAGVSKRLDEAASGVGLADEALELARNDEFAAREREPELHSLDERVARLRAASEAVTRLDGLRKEHATRLAEQSVRGDQLGVEEETIATAEQAIAALEAEAAKTLALEEVRREQVARRTLLVARLERARQRASLEARLTERSVRLSSIESQVEAARAALTSAEEVLRRAQAADRLAAAERLAEGLIEGEACPVCGATEHPAPVAHGDGSDADDSTAIDHEALDDAVAAARARLEPLVTEEASLAGEQSSETRALEALEDPTETERTPRPSVAELALALADIDREGEEGEAALQAAGAARDALADRRKAFEERRADVERLRRDHAAAAAGIDEAARAIDALSESLPEEGRSQDALESAVEMASSRRGALAARIESTAQAVGVAERTRAEREATRIAALEERVRAERAVTDAKQAADEARRSAAFEDEAAVLAARLEEEARAALQSRIEEFDRSLEGARARRESAVSAAEGAMAADVEALEAVLATQSKILAERMDAVGRLEERSTGWARLAEALEAQRERSGALLLRFERIGALADVASGANPERVSFQRFVLAAFLDEVLALATISLRRMSKGRYALQRVSELADRRRSTGLDLAVWDAHTGQERPVSTLSGGESFCAALALALGLAEVVQRHSGGTRLDAIFVDEGFGSLDPESLELALATLVELQSGGRLVGLISHVPELKERIDTRIEVTPGRGGSALSVTLP